jgi:hypothetical protein
MLTIDSSKNSKVERILMTLAAACAFTFGAQTAVGQIPPPDSEDVEFFFVTDGELLVRFQFPVGPLTTTVHRNNGQCIQAITAPYAEILVINPFTGAVVATGEGSLTVRATVDCETGKFYTYEESVVRGGGIVTTQDGTQSRLMAIATSSGGEIKLLRITLSPM